jgi:hypothetical protein
MRLPHQFGTTVVAAALLALLGCVPGKNYRFNRPVEEVPQQPGLPTGGTNWPPYLSTADQLPPGAACKAQQPDEFHVPCVAYIEFDDMGELRDRDKITGKSLQLDAALATINAAQKTLPSGVKSQPIVLVFVHGWKHNASPGPPEDANVQGVKDFLNMLHRTYKDQYVDSNDAACVFGPGCTTRLLHPVVGVYIAWRGNSISEAFPVAQTFSYFGREKTAYRVGNTSLTYALGEISAAAHPYNSDEDKLQPFLLLMGHSFGGLVLERALAQATMERLDDVAGNKRNASFADLIVYLNTAAAATDSKQVLDVMAEQGVTKPDPDSNKRYPQIISLSSSWDQATLSAVTVGHALPTLGMKLAGSLRNPDKLVCYEPERAAASDQGHSTIDIFSGADFYLRTAPHFEAMQSHEIIALSGTDCRPDHLQQNVSLQPTRKVSLKPQAQPKSSKRDPNLRISLPAYALPDSFGPTQLPPGGNSCYMVVPKSIESIDSPRCNGTSYFVMEVPREIIPDHGTIFTQRLFQLLSIFLPPPVTAAGDPSIITHRALQANPLK